LATQLGGRLRRGWPREQTNSSQIAEARINYGGRGDITDAQKVPVGTSLLQRFWPF
jgi:hypothetical protein